MSAACSRVSAPECTVGTSSRRVAQHPGERVDVRIVRVGERLEGEPGVHQEQVGAGRLVEERHQVAQGGVEARRRIPIGVGQGLQPAVELIDLVRREGCEQERLGGVPAVERRPRHARLGGHRRQREPVRSPVADDAPGRRQDHVGSGRRLGHAGGTLPFSQACGGPRRGVRCGGDDISRWGGHTSPRGGR